MGLGSFLEKCSDSHNFRVAGAAGKIRMTIAPRLRGLVEIREKLSAIDSICNYDEFYKEAEFLVHPKESLHQVYYGTEAYRYGYYRELEEYSGLKKWFVPVFTAMEHGVRFTSIEWPYDANNIAYACQGDLRIDEIRKKNANMPIFVLGPYIQYARPYYDEAKTAELKKKLGKTLLVFLSHSTDSNLSRTSGENIVDEICNKYAADFDTVMVCVYWNDMKDPEVAQFRERGAMLSSAGYRADENFVRRLRSMIELSDFVIGNDLGTNVGFALALGKPYAIINSENRLPEDERYTKVYNEFVEAFTARDKYYFTDEQLELQKKLFEDYWGGGKYARTPEEVSAMLSVMKKICKMAHHNVDKIPDAINKYLEKEPAKEQERLQYKLLKEALQRD